ncbi:hypothetical protein CIPAW_09G182600 [Carya illinoinensis]|uniref:Uncharacterized protein n=1 Tax=Carya illinoinensis TaxID=32201 RepID=A0A8T1PJH6_CARIL|nr:hypothetical protein CIPAW_09G182600 [Carya illinoinensis]
MTEEDRAGPPKGGAHVSFCRDSSAHHTNEDHFEMDKLWMPDFVVQSYGSICSAIPSVKHT